MNRPFARFALAALAALAFTASDAQDPPIKRTLLQRVDLGDGREAILGMAEIAPGGATGRHTHFGVETGYVAQGDTTLEIEGQGTRTLKAGDSYAIPAGRVHNARNDGKSPARVIATYIVDKDKPLATAVP